MGILVYSLLWVMQDLYHQPFSPILDAMGFRVQGSSGVYGAPVSLNPKPKHLTTSSTDSSALKPEPLNFIREPLCKKQVLRAR